MFGCVLENTIENTFSLCCSHFLTFSQLPNKYIISFLNRETQKNQNPKKKFIKFDQIQRRRKRGRRLGSITRRRRRQDRAAEVIGFDLEARSHGGGEDEHDQNGFIGDGFEHDGGAEAARLDQRWV